MNSSAAAGKRLRGVVIGAGFWTNYQLWGWKMIPGVELAAIQNRTVTKAQNLANKFGIPAVYADAEEMIVKEKPDFVDIITEVPTHADLVGLAAKHRIPVICQKPMGPDYETCKAMVDTCAKAGVPFFIHENFRWMAQYRALGDVLRAAPAGRPRRGQITLRATNREGYEKQPFTLNQPHSILTDMGCHLFDLARYFFGEPTSLYCHSMKRWDDLVAETMCAVLLRYPTMLCTCAMSQNINSIVFVDCEDGTIELFRDGSMEIKTSAGVTRKPCPTWPPLPWETPHETALFWNNYSQAIVDCLRDLYKALATGGLAETHGADYLKTMRLVYAAVESAEKDKAVHLD